MYTKRPSLVNQKSCFINTDFFLELRFEFPQRPAREPQRKNENGLLNKKTCLLNPPAWFIKPHFVV